MEDSQADMMLVLARGVLPELPCELDVLSEDGGSFPLAVDREEEGMLLGVAPRDRIRKELLLLARLTDDSRGRYDIELVVKDTFWYTQNEAQVQLQVANVEHKKMRRIAPRVAVGADAVVRVISSSSKGSNSQLEVKLADISATGAAFHATVPFDPGDVIELRTALDGRMMFLQAKVVRCAAGPWSRYHVGCQLTVVEPEDRELIATMAEQAPTTADEQHEPVTRSRLFG
jgi:hypothetical protein